MSNWNFLNRHRIRHGLFRSDEGDGFNGAFEFEALGRMVRCIASDGLGWEHVSVSQMESRQPPNWDVMCFIKELFWEPEDWVMQFHPARSQYVNNHPGCLHLWKQDAPFPVPDSILVGCKELNV